MPAASAVVRLGVDVLLADDAALLHGRRVGLITNHTGRTSAGTSTIDALHEHPAVELVALFSPEHGIRGSAEAGERVDHSRDDRTGLPVHSLYGETREPTAAMLADVDVLVFDIQDIGARYYTYVWTMALAMQAAANAALPFVVLDRPNPIGGQRVDGNMLDSAYATFVGLFPVPMRHGLTAGELARYINAEHGIGAELHVVPLDGWRRALHFDETSLDWVAPSPNMPDLESALHYPGTCLFEGTNLSVGRGTDRAFQQIGAPWLDAERIAERLAARLHGVRVAAVRFTPIAPGDGKFAELEVAGLRFTVTDREVYDPVMTAIATLEELQRAHADSLRFHVAHFDRLAGTDQVRLALLRGEGVDAVTQTWASEQRAFRTRSEPYRLYH